MQRLGVRNNPHYRIVAKDPRTPRDGKYHELLGNYCPTPDPKTGLKRLQVNQDRVLHWISLGAEPSSRVAWLLGKAGVLPAPPTPIASTVSAKPKKKAQERLLEKQEKLKLKADEDAAQKKVE